MGLYKKFAGQTVLYGLGTVLAKILNFIILTPYYTNKLDTFEYGIFTELYAYAIFLNVILLYGLETGLFNFSSKNNDRKKLVFSTAFICVVSTSVLFFILVYTFNIPIAKFLQYEHNNEFILIFAGILSIDAITTIVLAQLRFLNKALEFSLVNLFNVICTIGLVLFFFEVLPGLFIYDTLTNWLDIDKKVTFIFYANLLASMLKLLVLIPFICKNIQFTFDLRLLKNLLAYSWPLLVSGLAGALNEVLDRTIYKFIIDDNQVALKELGIYGANLKIGIIISLMVTMFRYTAEPFFFSLYKEKGSGFFYSRIMTLFTVFLIGIFLGVNYYIDIIKYMIGDHFWVGLKIVPVILFGYLLFGLLVNVNFWFKLSGKTKYAILIMCIGLSITASINILFIEKYRYYACAYGHVASFGVMLICSYLLGRKIHPINYELKKLSFYFSLGAILFIIDMYVNFNFIYEELFNSLLLIVFIFTAIKKEELVKAFKKEIIQQN